MSGLIFEFASITFKPLFMATRTNSKPALKGTAFERFSNKATKVTGSSAAFTLACITVIVWAISGPFFKFSEAWQLVINTGTTIVTFLMVFIIQKSQNKDSLAIQLKLNELVAAHEFASNRMVNVEDMTEEELLVIQKYYTKLSEMTKIAKPIKQSHSIDEAEENYEEKIVRQKKAS